MAEREVISWLLAEELEEEPWEGFDYWYAGAPEYSDFPAWCERFEYRTAFVCELFGQVETPEGWERVTVFAHSGEGPCPFQGCDMGEEVEECPLCEHEAESGRHPYEGWLYIGDGWREVVYRRRRED